MCFFIAKVAKLAKNLKSFFSKTFRVQVSFQAPTIAKMQKFMNQIKTTKIEFTKHTKKCFFIFGKTFAPETKD